jgi:hypothetical protein
VSVKVKEMWEEAVMAYFRNIVTFSWKDRKAVKDLIQNGQSPGQISEQSCSKYKSKEKLFK